MLLAMRALIVVCRRNDFGAGFARTDHGATLTMPVYGCEARCGAMRTVLTTADIAERKRFQFWQDAVCDTFVELDCQAGVEERFFGEITTAECEGLHFSTVRSDSQIVKRTRRRIRRAREEIMLISLQVRGIGIIAQDGREARLMPGDFACYDSTRPYTLNFDSSFEQLVLHMPPRRWCGGSAVPSFGRRGGSRAQAPSARWCCRSCSAPPRLFPTLRRRPRAACRRHACRW